MNFLNIFKHIEQDCKFLPSTNSLFSKKELIIPLLYSPMDEINKPRDYYIEKFIYDYNQTTSPSTLAKFEIVIDYIEKNELFPEYKIKRKYNYIFSEFTKTELNTPWTNVLKTTVLEMNAVSPIITGQFFENVINLAIGLDISQEINPGPNITEQPDDIGHLINSLQTENGFYKTNFHKCLGMCLLTQIVHATDLTNYFMEFIAVRKLLDSQWYLSMLEVYFAEIKKTFITKLKNPKKSVKLISEDPLMSGEADIITFDSVIDIKCYKNECIKLWQYQLEIYNNSLDKPKNKLMIINLLSNKVYTWKTNFETIYNQQEQRQQTKQKQLRQGIKILNINDGFNENNKSDELNDFEENILISEDEEDSTTSNIC